MQLLDKKPMIRERKTAASQYNDCAMQDIEYTQRMAQKLLETGHYQKIGPAGVFAVTQMARSLGIDVMQALNGGLYPVDGKIEMDGRTMMSLIRQYGHSICKDPSSTATLCILHGKRSDNGDTWTESFGIEDAKNAGLLSKSIYQKYSRDMFQWRALSRLARFLFPDVIKGCYVRGEISEAPPLNEKVDMKKQEEIASRLNSSLEIDIQETEERQPIKEELPPEATQEEIDAYLETFSDKKESFKEFMEAVIVKRGWNYAKCIQAFKAETDRAIYAFKAWVKKKECDNVEFVC